MPIAGPPGAPSCPSRSCPGSSPLPPASIPSPFPATIAAIVREALRTKSSAGQVVDRLAGGLAVRDSSAT